MSARPGLFVTVFDAALGRDKGLTQPEDARLALAGLLEDPTVPGILYDPTGGNLLVTGSTTGPNMIYQIADGTAATLRVAGAGLQVWPNDGTVTEDTGAPAPGSGSRYDLIWARGKDGSTGGPDTDSDPEFGFTVGTSAPSNPTKPYADIPDGALVLAESLVAAGNANASQAVITMVAPFKVGAGAPVPVRSATERNVLTQKVGRQVVRLDASGRVETYTGTAWNFVDWTNLPIDVGGWTAPTEPTGKRWQTTWRNGRVSFRGTLANATFSGGWTTVCHLPSGVPFPGDTVALSLAGNTTTVRAAQVLATGEVQVFASAGSGAWFIIGGGYPA